MDFQKDHIYHIYNQGNNQRKIFFERENYLFFLRKVKTYLSPYSDILSWCLMPNHFHFMMLVKELDIIPKLVATHRVTQSHPMSKNTKPRSINQSIAIVLRSYTRAINKQRGFTGALFREDTKAECINCPKGINSSWFVENGIPIGNVHHDYDYPKICFDYIHQNPVKAGLVKSTTDWEFSSAMDYAGMRNGSLINKGAALLFGLVDSPGDSKSPGE